MSSTTTYITNKCYGNDFGSQYKYLIDILLMCYANGYEFVYNKITHMENNYDNDPAFIEKMENLMNLRPHFTPFGDESLNNAFITIYDMTVKNVISANMDYYVTDENLGRIKQMFWANKDRTNLFDNNGKTNVVIYIPEDTNTAYGPIYMKMIQILRDNQSTLIQNGDLLFHIYSRGSIDDFQSYNAEDIILHINEDIESTFIHMVAADIFILTNNLFCYSAALLSNGIVYNYSNENPSRNTWISFYTFWH